MIYHPLFKLVVFIVLAVPTVLLFREGISGRSFNGKQSGILLAIAIGLTFIVRAIYLRDIEIDVDTSTWLSSAITFYWYPDKLWTLLTFSDSRPLTILPLIVAGWVGAPLHYATAELVGLLLSLASAATMYYICALISGRTTALMITATMCLFLATLAPFFAAYNSEHPSILMLLICISATISYVYGRWSSAWIAGATGLLLGSLVFAKFQNVPMGMLTGVFLMIVFVRNKAWLSLALLLAGAVIPTLAVNLYYISLGKFSEFWNAYFWNYYDYSFTTHFSSLTMKQRFGIVRIIRFLFFSPYSGYYMVSTCAIILIGILLFYKPLRRSDWALKSISVFSVLLCTLTVYAVLQAGNNFEHYKLYLLIPFLLLMAVVFSGDVVWKKYLLIVLLTGTLIQTAVNMLYLEEPVPEASFARIDEAVTRSIQHYSQPGEPIMIYGWRDQLHVRTMRPQGFRNVHPFHFSVGSPLVSFWTQAFYEDMKANPPRIFMEALLPEYSERAEMFLPFEKVPAIHSYIQKNYRLAEEVSGVRIFVRK